MPHQLSLNLGLDVMPISQSPDTLPDLLRLYNACNLLASQIDDFTGAIGAEPSTWSQQGASRIVTQNGARLYCQTTEALSPGNVVTLYNSGATTLAKKAGGSTWQGYARGFVLDTFAANSWCEIFLIGVNNAIAGMTPGTVYYISEGTPGLIAASTGTHAQKVGYALSTTQLWFCPSF
jgi:hypothetical protein